MTTITLHRLGRALFALTAVIAAGCADDGVLSPGSEQSNMANVTRAVHGTASTSNALFAVANPPGELGVCSNLQVPRRTTPALRLYASGAQIYRWNGSAWSFVAPSAPLYADAGGQSIVGTHYAGPTWESVSGSKVVGAVVDRCTPDPDAIPWLLLRAVATEGPGVFHDVDFIQRLNTVGGNAPSAPGMFVGDEARVPYSTEYLFYRTN